jgi:hypothetical protein
VKANSHVFAVSENEGQLVIETTPAGRAPVARDQHTDHNLRERFVTPQPKPSVAPAFERHVLEPSWSPEQQPRQGADQTLFGQNPPAAVIVDRHVLPPVLPPEEELPVEPPAEEAAADELEVVLPVADEPVMAEVPSCEEEVESPLVEAEAGDEATPAPRYDDLAAAMVGEPLSTDEEEQLFVEEEPIAEVEAPVGEEMDVAEPSAAVTEPEAIRPVPPVAARVSDVSSFEDAELAAAITDRLRADPRVANFGDKWMLEDRVPRFSRGDLRRMKEYIQEQEQPLTDDVLVLDVLGVRPNSPDFDMTRYAVNYRLSREHRDFEFLGTNYKRFWSTSSLPQIGTTRRKPNELGTDYRYLLDELPENPQDHSADSVLHVVTVFE